MLGLKFLCKFKLMYSTLYNIKSISKHILVFILLLILGATSYHAQNFNRPVPASMPQYEFHRMDTTDLGSYYFCAPYLHNGGNTTSKSMMLIDQNGYLVWATGGAQKFFDFKYHPDHSVFSFTNRQGPVINHFIMDSTFSIIDSISTPSGYGDVHEFQMFPNGNYCFIGGADSVLDLSSFIIDGGPGSVNTNVRDFIIWEFDPSHNLVMRWSALDHIPADVFVDGYAYNASSFDFAHGNSVELDTDGNLIVSMRTANAVYKIDHSTGSIIWRLGGDYNEFTFLNDAGFYGQHDARRLANGNITLFDNQFGTTAGSRGVEYSLNHNDSTAFKVSEYAYSWPLNCYSLGSYRMLENGYQIIGWGNVKRPEPSMTLLDSNQNVAADFFFSDTVVTYRAFFEEFEFKIPQPEITCTNDGTVLTLSAPSSSNYYLWSTGESTQTITVGDTGTYVVWVDQGIGILGSDPYFIEDLASHCIQTGIIDLPERTPEHTTFVGYFDLLGRKIIQLPIGSVYLELYSDGKYYKRLTWEK